jgi:Family of unknown function (DUF6400)
VGHHGLRGDGVVQAWLLVDLFIPPGGPVTLDPEGRLFISANAGPAITGNNTSTVSDTGVQGVSAAGDGVQGVSKSNQHAGVSGLNNGGGFGVFAQGNPAGLFQGDIHVTDLMAGSAMANLDFAYDLTLDEARRRSAVLEAIGDDWDPIAVLAEEQKAYDMLYSDLDEEQQRVYDELVRAGVLPERTADRVTD